MKKIIAAVFSALAALALCICFAACSSTPEENVPTVIGTWKFESMTETQGGKTETVKVGDPAPWAAEGSDEKITGDFYVLVTKEDNTFDNTMKGEGGVNLSVSGTWVEKDGKYEFTVKGMTQIATLDGNTLTMTDTNKFYSSTVVFKKSK